MKSPCASDPIRLVDRPHDAILFAGPAGAITTSAFLRDAARCAASLRCTPGHTHIVNCCQDRYWFAVAFAAAVSCGRISLLTGDQSAPGLAALAARFPGLHAIRDDDTPVAAIRDDDTPVAAIRDDDTPVAAIRDDTPVATLPGIRMDRQAAADTWPPAEPPCIPAGQPAALVFTSGSSGEPVAFAKTFGELAMRSRAAAERFGFDAADPVTILGTVPPNHMYGFETTILLPLHGPAASWCGPVFYPADLAAALAALPGLPISGRRVLVTTPLQLRGLLQAPPSDRPPSLVISATAPLDPALARAAERLWGTEVMEIFGATEVGSIASRRPTADSIWSIYPDVTLTGEHAPLVMAPFSAPRRLPDVIELLDDGRRFRLIGRAGDIVKRGGRRASLAGLTRLLNEIDGVQDGVFLAPDDLESRAGARLLAFVVAPTRSREDVLKALRTRIDPIFLPRPLLCVESLPRNALGKLPREALLALAMRSQEGASLAMRSQEGADAG